MKRRPFAKYWQTELYKGEAVYSLCDRKRIIKYYSNELRPLNAYFIHPRTIIKCQRLINTIYNSQLHLNLSSRSSQHSDCVGPYQLSAALFVIIFNELTDFQWTSFLCQTTQTIAYIFLIWLFNGSNTGTWYSWCRSNISPILNALMTIVDCLTDWLTNQPTNQLIRPNNMMQSS
jgi:hypothetical protein